MGREVTEKEELMIVQLTVAGKDRTEIAEAVRFSKITVYKYQKKHGLL